MPHVELTTDDLYALNRQATVARMLSTLAHNVNNALQVIAGTAELLQQRSDLGEPTRQGLARIRGRASAAAAVVGEVLAFSQARPEARGTLQLGAIARRAVLLHGNDLSRANIDVRLEIDEADALVEGYESQLLQVALNLIDNAEGALRPVTGATLTVSVVVEGGDAVLRVADNGPGVAAHDRDRIFDPFVSTGPRGQVRGQMQGQMPPQGLGLPVSVALAREHGGSLVIEPSAVGATFALRLPRVVP
jgi:signal transduction histidine kinase